MTAISTQAPFVESRVWQTEECLPRDELEALQLQRLRAVIERVAQTPFYSNAFCKLGIRVEDMRTLDDLHRLPFTTKADLRDQYPNGFLAVERERVARFHGSSGTTGKPTFVAYTRLDLENWSDMVARVLVGGGLRPEHTVQIAFGYGLFTGGFGLHYGVERVGAAVIPASSGNTQRQITILRDLAPEVLVCTPSYALRLAEVIQEQGIARDELALRYAHFGGEPWTEDMRAHIEDALGILCFNNYGLSEIVGPGISGECAWRRGMHIQEDHFLVECLDPETLEPVPEGTPGELVFTTLTREAFPLLRYRTRDIAALDHAPCPCGRTGVRMARVTGRTDDMLIVRGVNVFPSQVEEALLSIDGAAPHYLIEIDRPGSLDEITVHIEVRPEFFSDSMSRMQALRHQIAHAIATVTGVQMQVKLVEPQTIERFDGKARRVIDHRRT